MIGNDGNYGDFNARSFCRKLINFPINPDMNSNNNFETEKGRSLKTTHEINKMYKLTTRNDNYKEGGNYFNLIEFRYKLLANEWQNGKHSYYRNSTAIGSIRNRQGWSLKIEAKHAWENLPWKMHKLCKQGIRDKNDNNPSAKGAIRIKGHVMKLDNHVKPEPD